MGLSVESFSLPHSFQLDSNWTQFLLKSILVHPNWRTGSPVDSGGLQSSWQSGGLHWTAVHLNPLDSTRLHRTPPDWGGLIPMGWHCLVMRSNHPLPNVGPSLCIPPPPLPPFAAAVRERPYGLSEAHSLLPTTPCHRRCRQPLHVIAAAANHATSSSPLPCRPPTSSTAMSTTATSSTATLS